MKKGTAGFILTYKLSCVLFICLLNATADISKNYEQLVLTVNEYIQLEDTAKDILKASDYLTEQVRLYSLTLNPEHARLYFDEVNVARRRENALALMRQHSLDKSREEILELAVTYSDALMIREIYAIKLIATAEGHTGTDFPAEVNAVVLNDADRNLGRQEMIDKARTLLFDQEYQTQKTMIYSYLEEKDPQKVCSKQLYREALQLMGEPKMWELQSICDIMNNGIADGTLSTWQPL